MLNSSIFLFVSQLSVLFFIPILSRSYTVKEFAAYASFFSFYIIGSSLSNFRLSDAIVKENKDNHPYLISIILFLSANIALFFGITSALYLGDIFYGGVFIFVSVFAYSVTRIYYFLDVFFARFARASFWLSSINIFTVLFQYFFSFHENGLQLGLMSALLLTVLLQTNVISLNLKLPALSNFNLLVKRNTGYIKYLTLYSLVGGLRSRMVYFFMDGSIMSGVLNQFEKVSNAPNNLISSIIRPVVFSKLNKEDIFGSEKIIGGLIFLLASFVIPIIIIVYNNSEIIVNFLLGPQWVLYHNYFSLVVAVYMSYMCFNWLDRLFDVMLKQKYLFYMELALCCISFMGLAIISYLQLTDYFIFLHLSMLMLIMVFTFFVI